MARVPEVPWIGLVGASNHTARASLYTVWRPGSGGDRQRLSEAPPVTRSLTMRTRTKVILVVLAVVGIVAAIEETCGVIWHLIRTSSVSCGAEG